jgi:hypothetical protein
MVYKLVRRNYDFMVVCGLHFGEISDESSFCLSSELSQHSLTHV